MAIRGYSQSLVAIRGHSRLFVVTRGYSWSLVVIGGHSLVVLDFGWDEFQAQIVEKLSKQLIESPLNAATEVTCDWLN